MATSLLSVVPENKKPSNGDGATPIIALALEHTILVQRTGTVARTLLKTCP